MDEVKVPKNIELLMYRLLEIRSRYKPSEYPEYYDRNFQLDQLLEIEDQEFVFTVKVNCRKWDVPPRLTVEERSERIACYEDIIEVVKTETSVRNGHEVHRDRLISFLESLVQGIKEVNLVAQGETLLRAKNETENL